MGRGQSWTLFALALVYAVAVSAYVGYSRTTAMTSATAADISPMAVFTFAMLLVSGLAFAVMVGFLDLITRRRQEFLAALMLGLTVFTTYEAVVQIAFEKAYDHYKSNLAPSENPTPSADSQQH
jgi:hypothetical protein